MGLIHLQLGLQMNDFLLKWFFSWGKKVFWGVFVPTHVVNKRICFDKNRQKAKHNEQTSLSWMFCFPYACQVGLKQQLRWRLRKRHLIITLNASRLIREMLANLVELNTKRLYRSSGKEKESRCLVPLPPKNVKLRTFTSKSWSDGKEMYKKASLWAGSLFGESGKNISSLTFSLQSSSSLLGILLGNQQTVSRKWSHCIPSNDNHPSNNRFPSVSLRNRRREKFSDARAQGEKRRGSVVYHFPQIPLGM